MLVTRKERYNSSKIDRMIVEISKVNLTMAFGEFVDNLCQDWREYCVSHTVAPDIYIWKCFLLLKMPARPARLLPLASHQIMTASEILFSRFNKCFIISWGIFCGTTLGILKRSLTNENREELQYSKINHFVYIQYFYILLLLW